MGATNKKIQGDQVYQLKQGISLASKVKGSLIKNKTRSVRSTTIYRSGQRQRRFCKGRRFQKEQKLWKSQMQLFSKRTAQHFHKRESKFRSIQRPSQLHVYIQGEELRRRNANNTGKVRPSHQSCYWPIHHYIITKNDANGDTRLNSQPRDT